MCDTDPGETKDARIKNKDCYFSYKTNWSKTKYLLSMCFFSLNNYFTVLQTCTLIYIKWDHMKYWPWLKGSLKKSAVRTQGFIFVFVEHKHSLSLLDLLITEWQRNTTYTLSRSSLATRLPLVLSPWQMLLDAGQVEILKPSIYISCFYHTL